ncbi:MAG: PD40 domain-containing protein [Anaerolineae bacterium]|nr:PD40 domain-containing protein [Anaerolineae bacterium]
MRKGDIYHDDTFTYHDPYSGRQVIRLTDYTGHSNHLYFTDPCWFNEGRSFVFTSDRDGHSNLFRYDLDDYKITQLTELQGRSIENERVFDHRPAGAYSAVNHRHYYWWQNGLYELDVDTCEERLVYQAPSDKVLGIHGITSADGRYVCNMVRDRVDGDTPATIDYPYSHFPHLYPSKPLTQVIRVEISTGEMQVVHEDHRFMTHVNLSPTMPDILTFCHEGPWHQVEQRIWGLNIQTGATWKIRPQDDDNFAIGHEYWFDDGEHIGYHGRPRDGKGDHVFGYVRWDNSEKVEVRFPFHSFHFASNGHQMIVGDGTRVFSHPDEPFIQLFKWDGERYIGPRVLTMHRSTFNGQHAHCHPRFTPDDKQVLYTSDLTGYSNMYLVEVGDFEDLPLLTADIKPQLT